MKCTIEWTSCKYEKTSTELNTIEDIIGIIDKYGHELIISKHKDIVTIEVYDDYRE